MSGMQDVKSRPSTPEYRENWDRIFAKSKKKVLQSPIDYHKDDIYWIEDELKLKSDCGC